MKNIFYFMLVMFCVSLIVIIYDYPKQEYNTKFKDTIVLEKDKDYFIGYVMYLKFIESKDSIKLYRVYQNFYEMYNVNDTIK